MERSNRMPQTTASFAEDGVTWIRDVRNMLKGILGELECITKSTCARQGLQKKSPPPSKAADTEMAAKSEEKQPLVNGPDGKTVLRKEAA